MHTKFHARDVKMITILLLIGCLAQAEDAQPVIDETVTTKSDEVEESEETTEVQSEVETTITVTVTQGDQQVDITVPVDPDQELDVNITDPSMTNWADSLKMLEEIKAEEIEATDSTEETTSSESSESE